MRAGCFVLLYAQPLTRIAALCTTDVTTTPSGDSTVMFARGTLTLPEPLAALAAELRDQRIAELNGPGWLFRVARPASTSAPNGCASA
jgi:hypothetical protein